jgi:hypothetical protein
VLTAAALGSSCGEEACGLFGELLKKLEVRAVPGIRVEDQPGIDRLGVSTILVEAPRARALSDESEPAQLPVARFRSM